jgi:hypothetical protein
LLPGKQIGWHKAFDREILYGRPEQATFDP